MGVTATSPSRDAIPAGRGSRRLCCHPFCGAMRRAPVGRQPRGDGCCSMHVWRTGASAFMRELVSQIIYVI
jgi:hypothetical protein